MTIEQLEQQRAARMDPADLPHTTTRGEAAAYARVTATLDQRLATARAAQATLAALPDGEADRRWLDVLNMWRPVLCDELLALPPRIRDQAGLAHQQDLTLSIRTIDFGVGEHGRGVYSGANWSLATSRLAALMRASGIEPADWRGNIKEVEHRLKDIERRRRQAQERLDSALMDDAERERREAETKELRDAFGSMRVKLSASGGLEVWEHGAPLSDESRLTPLQRKALAWQREALAATTSTST